jgi:hypothetical protein
LRIKASCRRVRAIEFPNIPDNPKIQKYYIRSWRACQG